MLSGQLVGLDEKSNVKFRLNSWDMAGVESFRSGSTYKANFVAAKTTTLCSLKKKDYDKIVDTVNVYFRKLTILSTVENPEKLYPFCKIVKYAKNTTVVKAGESMDGCNFYILVEGSATGQENESIFLEQKHFGEDGFFPFDTEGNVKKWPCTIVTQEPVKALVISPEGYNNPEFAAVRKYLWYHPPTARVRRPSTDGASSDTATATSSVQSWSLDEDEAATSTTATAPGDADPSKTSDSQAKPQEGEDSIQVQAAAPEIMAVGGGQASKRGSSNHRKSTDSPAAGPSDAASETESVAESTASQSKKKKKKKKRSKAAPATASVDNNTSTSTSNKPLASETSKKQPFPEPSGATSLYPVILNEPLVWVGRSIDSLSCGLSFLGAEDVAFQQQQQQQQRQPPPPKTGMWPSRL